MLDLVTRDRPDIVCLQELPVWALEHLESWSGMHATTAVARRPLLPVGARAATALHHGLFRSAFTGEGDAILTRSPARDLGEDLSLPWAEHAGHQTLMSAFLMISPNDARSRSIVAPKVAESW